MPIEASLSGGSLVFSILEFARLICRAGLRGSPDCWARAAAEACLASRSRCPTGTVVGPWRNSGSVVVTGSRSEAVVGAGTLEPGRSGNARRLRPPRRAPESLEGDVRARQHISEPNHGAIGLHTGPDAGHQEEDEVPVLPLPWTPECTEAGSCPRVRAGQPLRIRANLPLARQKELGALLHPIAQPSPGKTRPSLSSTSSRGQERFHGRLAPIVPVIHWLRLFPSAAAAAATFACSPGDMRRLSFPE